MALPLAPASRMALARARDTMLNAISALGWIPERAESRLLQSMTLLLETLAMVATDLLAEAGRREVRPCRDLDSEGLDAVPEPCRGLHIGADCPRCEETAEGILVPIEPYRSANVRLPVRGDCRSLYVGPHAAPDYHEREC